VHHAEVLVQQDVTVKQECARGSRVAKVHPQFHAVVRSLTFPKGNFNRVPQISVRSRFSIYFKNPEVYLVDVEGVSFQGAILNRPILNRSDFRRNYGLFVGFEDFLLLAVYRDVELDRPIGAAELF